MKTFNLLLLLSLSIFLYSCDDDDDEKTLEYHMTLSITSCDLNQKSSFSEFEVLEGKGGYTVESSDESVAVVKQENDIFYIFGLKKGNAVITVADIENNKAEIKVSVIETISRPEAETQEIQIKLGQKKPLANDYATDDGYIIDISDKSIISINKIDDLKNISADKLGSTSVTLTKDKWLYQTYQITVVEQYDLKLSETGIKFYLENNNGQPEVGVVIHSGNGQYSAVSTDSEIVDVKIKDYDLEYDIKNCQPAIAWVIPKKAGTAIITVRDEVSDQTADININITIKQ